MKYTQGPWHLIETKNLRNPELTNYLLCNKTPHIHGVLDGVNSPDADLIAAAPEMLDAIERAIRCLAVAVNNDAFKDCAAPLIGEITLRQLEAVFKKAKGE